MDLNNSQDEIVRAGAGAGKTYTLTHKVMEIADDHLQKVGKLPRVVVTTFTRKATQELRERLMLLALDEKPHLIDFINSRSQLVVSTIHGVLDLYLKRYGASLGIDPGFKLISNDEATKIARQVLKEIVLGQSEAEGLLEAIPFLQLVELVRRLDSLQIVNPQLAAFSFADFELMFTEYAAQLATALEECGAQIKSESNNDTWLAMADSYQNLATLLRKPNWSESRPVYVDMFESMKAGRRNRKAPPVDDSTADWAEAVRSDAKDLAFEPIYDPLVWRTFTDTYLQTELIAKKFAEQFRKAKLDRGMLEISDLEFWAMEGIRRYPETADSFSREWDHWLIDEYQDTSPFQVQLLRALSGDRPQFIVGDPQQSIYLFRGARSEVFHEKEKQIFQAGGRRQFLKMNRRSHPELLYFINDFFGHLRPTVAEKFAAMEPHFPNAAEPEKSGEKAVGKTDASRVVASYFIAAAENDSPDSTDSPDSCDMELEAISLHIRKLLADGANNEDICVLGRTNRTLIEVADYLAHQGLPTHVHVASGFYDRREIKDALAFLKFLANPYDNSNLLELLRSPWFRVPDGILAEMSNLREDCLWDSMIGQKSAADEFKAVARLNRLLQQSADVGFSEAFKHGLIDSGLFDLSHTQDVSGRREANLWKLLTQLQQEEMRSGFNLISFINGRVKALQLGDGNAEGDAVAAVEPDRINLMTIHSSKGLEFDHVILPRMHQAPGLTLKQDFTYDEVRGKWAMRVPYGEDRMMLRSLPEDLWLKHFCEQELREHARVLYVALTRAVKSVFMSWSGVPKANSWAEMSGIDLSIGSHQTENYTYVVMDELPDRVEIAKPELQDVVLPQPWRLTQRAQAQAQAKVQAQAMIEIGDKQGTHQNYLQAPAMSVTDLLERRRGVDYISPSTVGAAHNDSAFIDIQNSIQLAATGTAVHRLMELLKYPPSRGHIGALIQKWFPHQEQLVLQAIEYVRDLEVPPLQQIIQNGFVEWSFAFVESDILIEGQIDLWGKSASGDVWIIDYKTGTPALRQKAFDQMSLYALALRKGELVDPAVKIKLAAIYPFLGKVYTSLEHNRGHLSEIFGI
jgi:ATP-dependent helicase/nuclease subunit A